MMIDGASIAYDGRVCQGDRVRYLLPSAHLHEHLTCVSIQEVEQVIHLDERYIMDVDDRIQQLRERAIGALYHAKRLGTENHPQAEMCAVVYANTLVEAIAVVTGREIEEVEQEIEEAVFATLMT